MSSMQLPSTSFRMGKGLSYLPSFHGFRPSAFGLSSSLGATSEASSILHRKRCFSRLSVKAATNVTPKYTSVKPLGDRVLLKIKTSEEKTTGGIFLPTAAQTKPQGGVVVAVGEGRTFGKNKVEIDLPTGAQVIYSRFAGTELEFNGCNHLILKEDDIVGILETDDVKDMKPLNDRVLIKIAEAEGKTTGGLLLTEATKEKPSIGTVVAIGPGPLDDEGNRKPVEVVPGSTVMYSKYAGNEFKGVDGSNYIDMRVSDVIAVLS